MATATIPEIQHAMARYKQHVGEYPYTLRLCPPHYGKHGSTLLLGGRAVPTERLPWDVKLCLVCTFGVVQAGEQTPTPEHPGEPLEEPHPEPPPEEEDAPTPPAEPDTPEEHAAAEKPSTEA